MTSYPTQPAPLCPICKINECSWDSEPPGPGSYFSNCTTCMRLSGYRDHSHTYYPNPAQVAAGAYPAGHSWRTSVSVRPTWEGGKHTGYRCTEFGTCGWEQRFTVEDLAACDVHTQRRLGEPIPLGVCRDYREHRQARGEVDKRGYITDHGREQYRLRSDAANWDPGRYVSRDGK